MESVEKFQNGLAQDPVIVILAEHMQKTGEVYAQTGATDFGPFGPALRAGIDELEKVVETNTGRRFSINTHRVIWNAYNTTFLKPTQEPSIAQVTAWRGKFQTGQKPNIALSS